MSPFDGGVLTCQFLESLKKKHFCTYYIINAQVHNILYSTNTVFCYSEIIYRNILRDSKSILEAILTLYWLIINLDKSEVLYSFNICIYFHL